MIFFFDQAIAAAGAAAETAAATVAAAEIAAAASVADAEARATAATEAAAAFAPAPPRAVSVLEVRRDNGWQIKKLKEIHRNVETLVQSQALCEPMAYFKRWFECEVGYDQFCELEQNIQHWDGTEWLSPAQERFRKGVVFGTQAAHENLTQNKYKSLYINDKIGLHDAQHTMML